MAIKRRPEDVASAAAVVSALAQRKNAEYSHPGLNLPGPGMSGLDIAAMMLGPVPVLGGATGLSADIEHYRKGELEPTPANLALSSLNVLPEGGAVVGALRGAGRFRPLYHGGVGATSDKLVAEGLTKGTHAELGEAGSSITSDPLLAHKFAGSPMNVEDIKRGIVRVDPTTGHEDIRNLRPSEYLMRDVPKDANAISLPNELPLNEAETFLRRTGEKASAAVKYLTDQEAHTFLRAAQSSEKAKSVTKMFFSKPLVDHKGNIIPNKTSFKNVADSLKGIRGNPSAFNERALELANGISAVAKGTKGRDYHAVPDLVKVKAELPLEFDLLTSRAEAYHAARTALATAQWELKNATISNTNSAAATVDRARRDIVKAREAFIAQFDNLAYNRTKLLQHKEIMDAFGPVQSRSEINFSKGVYE